MTNWSLMQITIFINQEIWLSRIKDTRVKRSFKKDSDHPLGVNRRQQKKLVHKAYKTKETNVERKASDKTQKRNILISKRWCWGSIRYGRKEKRKIHQTKQSMQQNKSVEDYWWNQNDGKWRKRAKVLFSKEESWKKLEKKNLDAGWISRRGQK